MTSLLCFIKILNFKFFILNLFYKILDIFKITLNISLNIFYAKIKIYLILNYLFVISRNKLFLIIIDYFLFYENLNLIILF